MENSLSSLLNNVLECYLVGAKKPVQANPTVSGERFRDHVYELIETHLPLNEQLLVSQCFEISEQGLLAARKGDLTAAESFLRGAELFLHTKQLSRESFLLGDSFFEAASAYFDYRRKDFDAAITCVHKALSNDLILEGEYGYAILHLHRIQLVHNLMRIDIRRAFIKEALNTGFFLLDYMEGKSATLSALTFWDSSCLIALPSELVNTMFLQITMEIALALAGNEALSTQVLFAGAQSHTQPGVADSCLLSPQSHAWLKAKQALIADDLEGFFEEAAKSLSDGPGNASWLWYAFVADLFSLCRKLDLPEAHLIRRSIARDARLWKGIPASWRLLFGSVELA